jgi:hypothetical protein
MLISKYAKKDLISLSLSFRLGRNLSSKQPHLSPFTKGESEGLPTSGNDNQKQQPLEQSSL